jgi:hypothetical protein
MEYCWYDIPERVVPIKIVEVITSKILRSPPWLGWPLWNICVTNDNGYVPLVINTSRSFPHSWSITGFVTRLTRRVPLVEQEIPTLPEHPSSPPVFSWVRVSRSLVLWVCFVDCCLSFFLLAIVLSVFLRLTDSDYLLWYLQTLPDHCLTFVLFLSSNVFVLSFALWLLITSFSIWYRQAFHNYCKTIAPTNSNFSTSPFFPYSWLRTA